VKDVRCFVENYKHKDEPLPPADAWFNCTGCRKETKVIESQIVTSQGDDNFEEMFCESCFGDKDAFLPISDWLNTSVHVKKMMEK